MGSWPRDCTVSKRDRQIEAKQENLTTKNTENDGQPFQNWFRSVHETQLVICFVTQGELYRSWRIVATQGPLRLAPHRLRQRYRRYRNSELDTRGGSPVVPKREQRCDDQPVHSRAMSGNNGAE